MCRYLNLARNGYLPRPWSRSEIDYSLRKFIEDSLHNGPIRRQILEIGAFSRDRFGLQFAHEGLKRNVQYANCCICISRKPNQITRKSLFAPQFL